MKGKNGLKILKFFDYFKIAFKTNMNNKQLYKPQILFLILRGVLILLSGLSLIELSQKLMPFVGSVNFTKFLSLFWSEFKETPLLILVVTLLVIAFGSTYVEAGLYAMYAKINRGDTDDLVFAEGANKYFFSFIAGNVLIALFWLIAAIPYIIVGLLTLTIAFAWIPIIVSAMLMVWKASIVSDDVGVFTALSNSFSFGKRHFIPTRVFIMIKSALSSMSGGGSGSSGNSSSVQNSFNDYGNGINNMPFDVPGQAFDRDFSGAVGTIVAIITSIISLMTVITGMINMIFEIFFGLTAVIIYQDDWFIEEAVEDVPFDEVNSDVLEVE